MEQYHIKCKPGDVGKYCILPGDPARCELIASHFENPMLVSSNREFAVYTGFLGSEKVSVCSTGIGGPGAAIAMEELIACGCHTFIRVGTCGGISLKVKSGDCVIAQSAVRNEGTTKEYASIEYPATADFDVICALKEAADDEGKKSHVGVVQSKDSFYGQHSPLRMPIREKLLARWEELKRLNVLCSEMEAASLFVVAATNNVRCGAVFHVLWNQERKAAGHNEPDDLDTSTAVKIAVEAIKKLIMKDKVVEI